MNCRLTKSLFPWQSRSGWATSNKTCKSPKYTKIVLWIHEFLAPAKHVKKWQKLMAGFRSGSSTSSPLCSAVDPCISSPISSVRTPGLKRRLCNGSSRWGTTGPARDPSSIDLTMHFRSMTKSWHSICLDHDQSLFGGRILTNTPYPNNDWSSGAVALGKAHHVTISSCCWQQCDWV